MRWLVAAVLLLVPACDRVFGLERDAQHDAGSDAGGELVTGRWMRAYATNTPTGAPKVVEVPMTTGVLSLQFTDEEQYRVEVAADGTFSFPRPAGATYHLIMNDGGQMIELEHSAPHLELAVLGAGRPERGAVSTSTPLTFSTHAVPGSRWIESTGLWTQTGMDFDSLDWSAAVSSSGPLGLLDASQGDRLYYVTYQPFSVGPDAYTGIAAEASQGVTIVDGQPQTVPLAPVPHVLDSCLNLVAHRAAAMARVLAAVPDATSYSDDWFIQSIPTPELGTVGPLTLAYATESGPLTDAAFVVAYRNPFAGTAAIASIGAAASRSLAYPGLPPISLFIGDRTFRLAPAGCSTPLVIDPAEGLPGTLTLDGVELSSDMKIVAVPATGRVEIAWNLSGAGPDDATYLHVYEVTSEGNTTTLGPPQAYETTRRSISIPAMQFVAGHYYVIRLDALLGVPNAAAGDLRTIAYPFSVATQFSRRFQIAP